MPVARQSALIRLLCASENARGQISFRRVGLVWLVAPMALLR